MISLLAARNALRRTDTILVARTSPVFPFATAYENAKIRSHVARFGR